jgi:hypothetical protein
MDKMIITKKVVACPGAQQGVLIELVFLLLKNWRVVRSTHRIPRTLLLRRRG